jgi:hypothetical protein
MWGVDAVVCMCEDESVAELALILRGTPMSLSAIRGLFWFSGLYDFLIGLVFLLERLCSIKQVCRFGCMFFSIALNPVANRNLIPFGVLLKVAYVGIVGFYWVTSGVPMLFKPFVVVDSIMLVLFLVALGTVMFPAKD